MYKTKTAAEFKREGGKNGPWACSFYEYHGRCRKDYEDFHEIKCQREGERKEKKDLSVSLTLKSGRRTTKSIY